MLRESPTPGVSEVAPKDPWTTSSAIAAWGSAVNSGLTPVVLTVPAVTPSTSTGSRVTGVTAATPSIPASSATACSGTPCRLTMPVETTASARRDSSIRPKTDSFIDAPRMPTAATSATPRVSAKAVAAVRLGLRDRFVRARRVITPPRRKRARNIERATTAMTRSTPRTMPTVPAPVRMPRAAVSHPVARAATNVTDRPATSSTAPMTVRTLNGTATDWSPERIACTGWTRPARRAGTQALRTVTTIPMPSGTRMLAASNPRPASGKPKPAAVMAHMISSTSPTPTRMPTAEPSTATSAASTMTEPLSWGRDMPRARSRANSRVRWATIMEKVLEMMNVPTSRAMRPKAKRM